MMKHTDDNLRPMTPDELANMIDTAMLKAIKISVSLDQKVGLPNYGSANVGLNLSGIPAGATKEDIEAALDTQKLVYDVLRERLRRMVDDARSQFEGERWDD